MSENKNVAVIGASDKTDRYSYKALKLLQEHGYNALPVHVRIKTIDGQSVYPTILDIKEPIDTLTMYVSANISSAMLEDILKVKPRRVIFNPGAENPQLERELERAGIKTIQACTLVMLKTGQFQK